MPLLPWWNYPTVRRRTYGSKKRVTYQYFQADLAMYYLNIESAATACAAVRRLLVTTVTRNPNGVRPAAKIGGKLR